MHYLIGLQCKICGHQHRYTPQYIQCEQCQSPWLEAIYDYDRLKPRLLQGLQERPFNLWRYRELLPVHGETAVSIFDEGGSPLVQARRLGQRLGHTPLYIKDERQSTTGSFKDRQAAVAVAAMLDQDVGECVLASAGNAAAAYAAYCAQAGIKLWVFVSDKVVPEKIREVALYGAEVVKVSGTYDQTKKIAADFARRRNLYFERGAKSLSSIAAMKTIAYELAEQMGKEEGTGWQTPGWYLQSVSGGLGPLGVYQGFRDLLALGLVDKLPKLAIVQVEGCSPMVRAFQAGQETADPMIPRTLIDVLSTGDPGYGYTQLYHAVREHGGTMISVTDEEAFKAMRRVARVEGMSMEPAAAVAFAGLEKMVAQGLLAAGESVVVNCTGHTFPVEKYILGDQWSVTVDLKTETAASDLPEDSLVAAIDQLEEKVTTIVIVDDKPTDSLLLQRFLERYKQYRVYMADNGREGIELIHERTPDLVILDLMMPEVDGFAVLKAIKEDPRTAKTPIIVVSAKDLTTQETIFLHAMTEAIWQKGNIAPQEFVENVVNVLTQNTN